MKYLEERYFRGTLFFTIENNGRLDCITLEHLIMKKWSKEWNMNIDFYGDPYSKDTKDHGLFTLPGSKGETVGTISEFLRSDQILISEDFTFFNKWTLAAFALDDSVAIETARQTVLVEMKRQLLSFQKIIKENKNGKASLEYTGKGRGQPDDWVMCLVFFVQSLNFRNNSWMSKE